MSASPERRRARWVVALVALLVVLVSAAGVGTTLWLRADADTSTHPVRVLLIGDSIMNQAGVYLEESLEARDGVVDVEVVNEGRNGTGLLTPGIYDWQPAAARLVEEVNPDIVVVLFVGNYTSTDLWVNDAGLEVEGYTDQFFQAWEGQARDLQATLVASGADVYWVNPPPMLNEEGVRRVEQFRLIHRRIAEDWTGTVLIDGTDALSTGDGDYAFELPDDEGIPQQVRTLDSVHLTRAGSQLLADEIARQVAPSALVAQRLQSLTETTTNGDAWAETG
jgi:hypothetical protein